MNISLSDEALADAERATDWYIEQDAWTAAETLQLEIRRAPQARASCRFTGFRFRWCIGCKATTSG